MNLSLTKYEKKKTILRSNSYPKKKASWSMSCFNVYLTPSIFQIHNFMIRSLAQSILTSTRLWTDWTIIYLLICSNWWAKLIWHLYVPHFKFVVFEFSTIWARDWRLHLTIVSTKTHVSSVVFPWGISTTYDSTTMVVPELWSEWSVVTDR